MEVKIHVAIRDGKVEVTTPARKFVVTAARFDGVDASQARVIVAKKSVEPAGLHHRKIAKKHHQLAHIRVRVHYLDACMRLGSRLGLG